MAKVVLKCEKNAGGKHMVSMDRIHKDLGIHPCRKCINERYKAALLPEDCQYYIYPVKCTKCGDVHNIVIGLNLSGKMKLLLK